MTNYTAQAVWNFDADELQTISHLKKMYVEQMHAWDLEGAYWILRSMWGEIDAKFDRGRKTSAAAKKDDEATETSEAQEAENKMGELEIFRGEFLSGTLEAGEFYKHVETFYRYLCRKMKEHGLYFREGDDPMRAVFRR